MSTPAPEELHTRLAAAVVRMDRAAVQQLTEEILTAGYSAADAIEQGLAVGMNEVGRLFARREYFVPEVLVCARAMYAGFDILKTGVTGAGPATKGTVVIGVVDGDFHDIGKNIVRLMVEAAGFRVVDLGKNIPAERFLEAVEAEAADIAALSTLMTTTMDSMAGTTQLLRERFPDLKVMVGGAPLSADFARSIGAHLYGADAREAVLGAHKLLGLAVEA